MRIEARSTDVAALQMITVRLPGGGSALLREIAHADDTGVDPDWLVRFNSQDAVGILVFKQPTANLTAVAEGRHPRIDALNQRLGSAYDLQVIKTPASSCAAACKTSVSNSRWRR